MSCQGYLAKKYLIAVRKCPVEKGFIKDKDGNCVCPPNTALNTNEECRPCVPERGFKVDESGHCVCALERGLIVNERGECVCPPEHGYELDYFGNCVKGNGRLILNNDWVHDEPHPLGTRLPVFFFFVYVY